MAELKGVSSNPERFHRLKETTAARSDAAVFVGISLRERPMAETETENGNSQFIRLCQKLFSTNKLLPFFNLDQSERIRHRLKSLCMSACGSRGSNSKSACLYFSMT